MSGWLPQAGVIISGIVIYAIGWTDGAARERELILGRPVRPGKPA